MTGGFQEAVKEGLVLCCPISWSQLVLLGGDSDRRSVFDARCKDCLVGVPWVGGSASVTQGSKFGCRRRFVALPSRVKKGSSGQWPQIKHGASEHGGTALLENAGLLFLGN